MHAIAAWSLAVNQELSGGGGGGEAGTEDQMAGEEKNSTNKHISKLWFQ